MIYRTIIEKVKKSISTKPITIITGSRQVGKSTLCKEIVKVYGYNYVSLDNSRELASAKNNPSMFLKEHKAPLIIDEVQKCEELFIELESIVNEARFNDIDNRGMYILISSQSYNLMKNIAESMAGRVSIITMSPLSIREIKGIKETPFLIDPKQNNIDAKTNKYSLDEFYNYIVRGFYSEIYDLNIEDIEQFYSDCVMSYIERCFTNYQFKRQIKISTFYENISLSYRGRISV